MIFVPVASPSTSVSTTFGGVFDVAASEQRLAAIETELSRPNAWDNPEALPPLLREKRQLEDEVSRLNALKTCHDDMHEWLERWNKAGDSMFDPEWLEWYGKNVHELILMLDSWGMEFEKDAQGRFKRKPGRGHREAVVFPGYKMQKKLRGILEKLGVVIVDRVMITELLTSDGHVAGATGFNVRTGQFYVFEAKNTVLSTGACSFKGQYHGQDMVSGEGNDMALRVGAEFTNMEFANTYNATAKDFDICGMSRFQCLGGRFTNALGETFMHKYDPVQGEGAMLHILVRAMTQEVRAGRGPISFDLRGMSEEDKDLSRRMLPMFFEACASKGVDPFSEPVEWIPGFMGSTSCGAGLTLKSFSCDTTIPGLFAAGETAGGNPNKFVGGCCAEGKLAARGAIAYMKDLELPPLDMAAVEQEKARVYAPLLARDEDGVRPVEMKERLQRLMDEYAGGVSQFYRTNEERLDYALKHIAMLQSQFGYLRARDLHELMQAHETMDRVDVAEAVVHHLKARKETRWAGWQTRSDYPERDDANFDCFIESRRDPATGKVETFTRPYEQLIPGDRYTA